jgi:hypothetical protein
MSLRFRFLTALAASGAIADNALSDSAEVGDADVALTPGRGPCGRPFVVEGETRIAAIMQRDGWAEALGAKGDVSIALAWARDAALEHASIASFARFTLELLAHGAPSDIVMAAQEAAGDEVVHAMDCFAIASRYAGRALGPGPLDVVGVEPARGLADVVAATVREGCVGETIASLLAEARLARAEEHDVRNALARIAADEARHAELAWRFVGWAIALGGPSVRAAALEAFAEAQRNAPSGFDHGLRAVDPTLLRAHGLLDEATAASVVSRALTDVIAPCAAALAANRAAA